MQNYRQIRATLTTAALMLTAVSSCVSVDKVDAPAKELSFNALANASTKAGTSYKPGSLGIFANLNTHVTGGVYSAEAWGGSDFWAVDGKGTLFLTDACFAPFGEVYAGANPNDIKKHEPEYWPDKGSLMFSAYSPHQSQTSCIQNVDYLNHAIPENMGYMMFTVSVDPTKVLEDAEHTNFDLLYADTEDINNAKTAENQAEAMPMLLHHAQAKVTFKISNPEGQFQVSAKLLNCVNSATFFSGQTPGWKPDFGNAELLKDYDIFKDIPLTAVPVEASATVIPMQLNGMYPSAGANTGHEVTLQLTLVDNDGVGRETRDFPLAQYTKTWVHGKHYTYNITIQSQKIVFGEPVIESRDQITDL